jgi:hypothetical protein
VTNDRQNVLVLLCLLAIDAEVGLEVASAYRFNPQIALGIVVEEQAPHLSIEG